MQEWLNNNDVLMQSTHNEDKSVIAEKLRKTFKAKIQKKLANNGSKSCLSYLNKLADQCNNIYPHSINEKAN